MIQEMIKKLGIPENVVRRGQGEVHSHAEGALRVLSGEADAALGVRLVARSYGLHFVPLAVTRCDLVIPSDLATHPAAAALSDSFCRLAFEAYRKSHGRGESCFRRRRR